MADLASGCIKATYAPQPTAQILRDLLAAWVCDSATAVRSAAWRTCALWTLLPTFLAQVHSATFYVTLFAVVADSRTSCACTSGLKAAGVFDVCARHSVSGRGRGGIERGTAAAVGLGAGDDL